jgi:hypothetical protein
LIYAVFSTGTSLLQRKKAAPSYIRITAGLAFAAKRIYHKLPDMLRSGILLYIGRRMLVLALEL